MIKLTFCLRGRPDLSRAAFQDYWLGTHAGLVAERAAIMGCRTFARSR